MKTAVLDGHAVMAYLEKESGWKEVTELLGAASRGDLCLLLSVVNWGEVCYITRRRYSKAAAERVVHTIDRFPVEIADVDRELTAQAARLKARGGISYADCFAAALAKREAGEVVTGDPEFERVEDEVAIHWLPRR